MLPTLSVLDTTPTLPTILPCTALGWTAQVAETAESLGYHRFWVTEHHAQPGIGGSSPAVLIAHLASLTSTIRLGSGGVMLSNHAPIRIAEEFQVLQGLHPGRIDLGVGRAAGGDQKVASALGRKGKESDWPDFDQRLSELEKLLSGQHEELSLALQGPPPSLHILSSSTDGAEYAAARGLPLTYALHLNPQDVEKACATYRQNFVSRSACDSQRIMLAVIVVCCQDDRLADRKALQAAVSKLRLRAARVAGLEASEELILSKLWSPQEERLGRQMVASAGTVVGNPTVVRQHLESLATRTSADEIMVLSPELRGEDRSRTLTSIAGE